MTSFNVWFPTLLLVLNFAGILLVLSNQDFRENLNEKSKYPIFSILFAILIDWGIGCFNVFGIWQIILLVLIVFKQAKEKRNKSSVVAQIAGSLFGLFLLFQCGGFDAMLNYMGYMDLLKYKITF